MLYCCGLGLVNQKTIVLLAWVQVPSLSCSHGLGTHEFLRDTLGTFPQLSLLPPAAHFLLHSPEGQEFWAHTPDVCLTSQASLLPRPRSSEEVTGH